MVISPQKNKNRGRCLHTLKSQNFMKYCNQQGFTLDRDEECISHIPAATLGEHAPSIRSLSWLTNWWGKGQEDVTIAMLSAALVTPSYLSSTALGKHTLEIKPASAAVYILSLGNMKMDSDVVFEQQKTIARSTRRERSQPKLPSPCHTHLPRRWVDLLCKALHLWVRAKSTIWKTKRSLSTASWKSNVVFVCDLSVRWCSSTEYWAHLTLKGANKQNQGFLTTSIGTWTVSQTLHRT